MPNIKTEKINITTELPTKLLNLTIIKSALDEVKKSKELISITKYYAENIEQLKKAKVILKDAIAEPTEKLKEIKEALELLETEIKEKALKVVKTNLVQKINKDTGEVKHELKHDLPTDAFSFTPEKVSEVIDLELIQAEYEKNGERSKFRHYFKKETKFVLDVQTLKSAINKGIKIPMTKKETPNKISIQVKKLLDPLKGLK